MPATCWPHGRHGAASLLLRAGDALRLGTRRQSGVLEAAARRRWHVGARLTRTRASPARCAISTRSRRLRAACAAPSPREKCQLTARRVACPR
eukprot:3074422-Prymnesium_polylepis.1